MSLTVVHHSATGHVVGAITGTGLGLPDKPTVEDLVGPDALVLHLRTSDNTVAELQLPTGDLAVATVPDPLNALAAPMAYQLGTTGPKLVQLSDSLRSLHPVKLTTSGVEVTVPTAAAKNRAVVVVLSTVGPLPGILPKGHKSVTLPRSLDLGHQHAVLLLLAGQFGLLDVCTVA